MKKLICIAIIFIMTASVSAHDFRSVDWGMSMSEVMKTEKSKPIMIDDNPKPGENQSLAYSVTLVGYKVIVAYEFVEDKLFRGYYLLNDIKHIDLNNYIKDFEKMKSAITRKYGEPVRDDMNWRNGYVRSYVKPKDYGFAVSRGVLSYSTKWSIDRTNISLTLGGKKGKITFGIIYEYSNDFNNF